MESQPPPELASRRNPGWAALERLPALAVQLGSADSVGGLLAATADAAVAELGARRALVLSVRDGRLTTEECGALADPGSDELRRAVLGEPIALVGRTREAWAVGHPDRLRGFSQCARSLLGERLGLGQPAYGALAPEGRTLALLVAELPVATDPLHQQAIALTGSVAGAALRLLVSRQRLDGIAAELRFMGSTLEALVADAVRAPTLMPDERRHGAVFPSATRRNDGEGAPVTLTARERVVGQLLVLGLTNREIAERLICSPETVKSHVSRLLRKLGAANRVELVGLLLASERPPGP